MFDWNLEIGTSRSLDLSRKMPCVHVAFGPDLAGDGENPRGGGVVEPLDVN
jgi:hypothetical protein